LERSSLQIRISDFLFYHTANSHFQVKAAYSASSSNADNGACSDAIRIVRQLYVSALDSGDIDAWKAALLQESDLDATHVEAIVQSIQVFASPFSPACFSLFFSVGFKLSESDSCSPG
jgi:hypothetical protein